MELLWIAFVVALLADAYIIGYRHGRNVTARVVAAQRDVIAMQNTYIEALEPKPKEPTRNVIPFRRRQ